MSAEVKALKSAPADGAVQESRMHDGTAQSESAPHNPIHIDADTCVKCDLCDWICPGDLIYKKPDDRETLPEVRYPDECWYCGLCQSICPVDAITIYFPSQMIRCRTDVTTLLGKVID